MKNKILVSSLSAACVLILAGLPNAAEAAQCSFNRDLQLNSSGSDVKCLQQYLNNSGFTISSKGAGSPGHETNTFYGLTKQAVAKWQKANGVSSTGKFGPVSRRKYAELTSAAPSQSPSQETAASVLSPSDIQAKINQILAQISNLKDKRDQLAAEKKDDQSEAKASVAEAKSALSDAHTKVDEAYRNGKAVDASNEYLKDAETKINEANRNYRDGNYSGSISLTNSAFELIDKALTRLGITGTTKPEAKLKIDQAEKSLESAQSKVDAARDQDKEVDSSDDILSRADKKLSEAKTYYDNKDYQSAVSRASEVTDLADDAIDAIGESQTSDAETAIKQAQTALGNAKSTLNSGNYRSAVDYLSDAKSGINEAKGSLDSKYSTAINYLGDARDYINQADNFIDDGQYQNAKNYVNYALERLTLTLKKF